MWNWHSTSPIAPMCWIRARWFITPPRVSSWPTTISRNATALCDPAHRQPINIREQVFQPRALCAPRVSNSRYSWRQEGYRRPHRLLLSNLLERNDKVFEVFGMKRILAAFVGFIGFTGLAAAQAPVAVVEDVQGKVTGAEFMDYVAPGAVIKIGPAGKVVLGYMKSCWRETITGVGTVIVGADESMVHLSEVKAGKVQCDSSQSNPIDREVRESAATVVRSIGGSSAMSPQLTLYGLSPVVESTSRGKLTVERLDVKGERYEVNLTTASVVRGKFYDFAKTGTALKPGGTYASSLGSRRTVFLVDSRAEAGPTPIIGRLVRLE